MAPSFLSSAPASSARSSPPPSIYPLRVPIRSTPSTFMAPLPWLPSANTTPSPAKTSSPQVSPNLPHPRPPLSPSALRLGQPGVERCRLPPATSGSSLTWTMPPIGSPHQHDAFPPFKTRAEASHEPHPKPHRHHLHSDRPLP